MLSEKQKGRQKEYRKNYKYYITYRWVIQGLKTDFMEAVYCKYMNSKGCDKCGHDFSYYKKCMDHCHKTAAFRNILCHACNSNDNCKNTSGVPNISFTKRNKRWKYKKAIKKVIYEKSFKTKQEAIDYKTQFELVN